MNAKVIYPIFLLLIISVNSCKKEFPDDPFAVTNLTVSDCKSIGLNNNGTSVEYIALKTVNDYYLQVNHINSVFNCEPGQIAISIEVTSNEISIDENETSSLANCICPYDIEFRLGPLQYGNYTVRFKKGGVTFKEYTLDFKKSTDIRVDLK